MRYFLTISYDGSKFYGFQRQHNVINVQSTIEDELSKVFNEKILVKGAGRTDRGVHAKNQALHFDSEKLINTKTLKKNLNKCLNNIHINKCRIVDDSFHSRFSVKKKHYSYKISFNSKKKNSEYVYFQKKLNIKKMKEASRAFIGIHNFQNFVSGERENYECIIYRIKFHHMFRNGVKIDFYGKSFYRYMVRNLVGALIDVGKNKATKHDIEHLLNSEKTDKMLSTAPAKGLTLENIYY